MFKTFKEWLTEKGINEEAYTGKTAEEMAKLQKDYMQYVSEQLKAASENGVSKEDIAEATKGLVKEDAIKGFLTKDSQEFKDFETRIQEAEEKAAMAIEKQGKTNSNPIEEAAKEIKENKDTLKQISNRTSNKEVVVKALTLRSSVATNNIGLDLQGLGQFGRKARTFYDFLSKQVIPLPADHGGIIRYP